jgi:type VI protein secretion system component VasA
VGFLVKPLKGAPTVQNTKFSKEVSRTRKLGGTSGVDTQILKSRSRGEDAEETSEGLQTALAVESARFAGDSRLMIMDVVHALFPLQA